MRSRILFLLCLLMTLAGCCRDQDLKLSPALMTWVPYTDQQQISFKSATGQQLAFVAHRASFHQAGSDKVCGTYDIETLQVNLTTKNDPAFRVQITLSHEVVVGIQVLRQVPPAMGLDILYNTISQQYISDPWRDRFFHEINLNGKTYHNVLYAYGSADAGPLSFADLYYGQEVGLIGFRVFGGEWYFLE